MLKRGKTTAEAKIAEATGLFYAAALDASRWEEALRAYQGIVGGEGSVLYGVDDAGSVSFAIAVDMSTEGQADYSRHYIRICPKIAYLERNPGSQHIYDYLYIDEPAIDRSEYYDWLQRAFGTRYFIGSRLRQEDGHKVYIGIQRTRRAGHVDDATIRTYTRLAVDLERAVRISRHLGALETSVASLRAALQASPAATLLLDFQGRLLDSNEAARAILREADGIRVEAGFVRMGSQAADLKWCHAISVALGTGLASSESGVILAVRPSGRRPLLLRIIPLSAFEASGALNAQARVAVFMSDPDAGIGGRERQLIELFGLTGKEALVAQEIAAGLDVREIARKAGISVGTARVHLERIMRKTGTHRQSHLVRLILKSTFATQ